MAGDPARHTRARDHELVRGSAPELVDPGKTVIYDLATGAALVRSARDAREILGREPGRYSVREPSPEDIAAFQEAHPESCRLVPRPTADAPLGAPPGQSLGRYVQPGQPFPEPPYPEPGQPIERPPGTSLVDDDADIIRADFQDGD